MYFRSLAILLLLASNTSCSLFPFRELLFLKAESRIQPSECARSYIIQRMVSLLSKKNISSSYGEKLLRGITLDGLLNTEGRVLQQGRAFGQLLVLKSKGMISGILEKTNAGPEVPFELLSFFEKKEWTALQKLFRSSEDNLNFFVSNQLEPWIRLTMEEAFIAWKHFCTHFEYIPCKKNVFDYKLKSLVPIEDRMKFYLDAYERSVEPIVFKFDFGSSFATVVAMFYLFQYLHQISRVYSPSLSGAMMDRLQRAHEKFISGALEFATKIPETQRTLLGSLSFDGLWFCNSQLNDGVLVPSKYHHLDLSHKYKSVVPLTKVSLYYVPFEPREQYRFWPLSDCIKWSQTNNL